jgi:uncharacterized protein (TIGR02611 family)
MHSVGTLFRFIWRSSKRAVVFVVGVTLIVVGLIMFVTPGPGILLLVAGLAVLASEFAWAEHLLDKAKEQAAKAGSSAQKVPGVSRVTGFLTRLVPRRWRRTSPADSTPEAGTEPSETPTAAPVAADSAGDDTIDLTDAATDAATDTEPATDADSPGQATTGSGRSHRRPGPVRHRSPHATDDDESPSIDLTDTAATNTGQGDNDPSGPARADAERR